MVSRQAPAPQGQPLRQAVEHGNQPTAAVAADGNVAAGSKIAALTRTLEELNMGQYLWDFVEAGFDDWDVLCQIRESDLEALKVKLGHRRRLQNRIATEQGYLLDPDLAAERKRLRPELEATADVVDDDDADADDDDDDKAVAAPRKRKYVRHPKVDLNAPKRALSAYAAFANDQRKERDYSTWSFADTAKHIGSQWRGLPPDEKERYHAKASAAKVAFADRMDRYKATEDHEQYQRYLTEWKVKHGRKPRDGHAASGKKLVRSDGNSASVSPAPADGAGSRVDEWASSVMTTSTPSLSRDPNRSSALDSCSLSDCSPLSATSIMAAAASVMPHGAGTTNTNTHTHTNNNTTATTTSSSSFDPLDMAAAMASTTTMDGAWQCAWPCSCHDLAGLIELGPMGDGANDSVGLATPGTMGSPDLKSTGAGAGAGAGMSYAASMDIHLMDMDR